MIGLQLALTIVSTALCLVNLVLIIKHYTDRGELKRAIGFAVFTVCFVAAVLTVIAYGVYDG